MSATLFGPGEGHRYIARGSEMFFKAMAATTGGAFSLMERTLPPGGTPPPRHVHLEAAEGFYLLDGRLRFWLDDDVLDVEAGAFVLAPGGVMHTFGNVFDEPARLLILHAPAMDAYFAELHNLWSDPASPPLRSEEQELMRRHGMRPEV